MKKNNFFKSKCLLMLCAWCALGMVLNGQNVMAKKRTGSEQTREYTEEQTEEVQEENVQLEKSESNEQIEYIIPDSVSRYLSRDEISGMPLQILNYAKNEIYAREGRIFQSQELRSYFENTSWYQGTIQPDDFKDSERLNEYELSNTKLLSELEHEIAADGYQVDQPGYSADPVYAFIAEQNGQGSQVNENAEDVKQNAKPESGKSEEEEAYTQYAASGSFVEDYEGMYDLRSAVKDLDGDGVRELIIKGKIDDEVNTKYKYIFYRYKDKNVYRIGSLENWQNGGDGEIYTTQKAGTVVVFWRIADRKTYKVYEIGDSVEEMLDVYRQDTTNNDTEGKRIWIYGTSDGDGNELNVPVSSEQEWSQFEDELKEITFYSLEG